MWGFVNEKNQGCKKKLKLVEGKWVKNRFFKVLGLGTFKHIIYSLSVIAALRRGVLSIQTPICEENKAAEAAIARPYMPPRIQ